MSSNPTGAFIFTFKFPKISKHIFRSNTSIIKLENSKTRKVLWLQCTFIQIYIDRCPIHLNNVRSSIFISFGCLKIICSNQFGFYNWNWVVNSTQIWLLLLYIIIWNVIVFFGLEVYITNSCRKLAVNLAFTNLILSYIFHNYTN